MKQSAAVYPVNGKIIVAPVVRTTMGVGLQVDPCGCSAFDGEFLMALREALEKSAKVVGHPSRGEWSGGFKPFLAVAKLRSYKAFMSDAKLVDVNLRDGQIELVPQRNLGSAQGFEPRADGALRISVTDESDALSAFRRLFA